MVPTDPTGIVMMAGGERDVPQRAVDTITIARNKDGSVSTRITSRPTDGADGELLVPAESQDEDNQSFKTWADAALFVTELFATIAGEPAVEEAPVDSAVVEDTSGVFDSGMQPGEDTPPLAPRRNVEFAGQRTFYGS